MSSEDNNCTLRFGGCLAQKKYFDLVSLTAQHTSRILAGVLGYSGVVHCPRSSHLRGDCVPLGLRRKWVRALVFLLVAISIWQRLQCLVQLRF